MDQELILTHREDPPELEVMREEIEGQPFEMSQTISNFRIFINCVYLACTYVYYLWRFQPNLLVFSQLGAQLVLNFMISFYFVAKSAQVLAFITRKFLLQSLPPIPYDVDFIIFAIFLVYILNTHTINRYVFDMRRLGYSIPVIPRTHPVVFNYPPRDQRPNPNIGEEFHQVLREAQVIRMNPDDLRQRG